MDYSKMSDADLNASVMEVLSDGNQAYRLGTGSAIELLHQVNTVEFGEHIEREEVYATFDPCNNPADAWPIIVGQKLSLINADDEWLCVPGDTAVDGTTGDEVQMIYSGDGHVHANPLRAAMIVFLMMQGSANVQDNPAR